nr:hypothetical protein [uncultured Devosia sp.]
MRTITIVLAYAVLATGASAQDKPSFSGIFSTDEAACKQVTDGLASVSPDYTLFDPEKGIATLDFHCDFLDIKAHAGWYVATAFCEEPGIQWGDLITFTDNGGSDNVTVTSLSGMANPDMALADGSYHRCTAP